MSARRFRKRLRNAVAPWVRRVATRESDAQIENLRHTTIDHFIADIRQLTCVAKLVESIAAAFLEGATVTETPNTPDLIELTADIVSAYVGANSVSAADLPALIKATYGALAGAETPPAPVEEAKAPAVSIKKSIGDDYLICLEDGRKFKSLKRHLRTKYNLSPEDYRAKWGLPKTYPMVAPSYAAARSNLAKQMGLGQGGRSVAAPTSLTPAPEQVWPSRPPFLEWISPQARLWRPASPQAPP